MSHSVVIQGANFTNYVDRSLPYLDLAKGYWLFGTDFATSKINHAPAGGPDLVANGTITYGEGYAEFPALGSYFSTGLSVTDSHTLIVVHSATLASRHDVMMSAGVYDRLAHLQGLQVRTGGTFGGAAVGSHVIGSSYGFAASSTAGLNATPIKGYGTTVSGTLAETVSSNLGGNLPAASVTIGPELASYGAVGGHRQAAAMLFDQQLTLAQLQEIYSYFRFKMPARGITVF